MKVTSATSSTASHEVTMGNLASNGGSLPSPVSLKESAKLRMARELVRFGEFQGNIGVSVR